MPKFAVIMAARNAESTIGRAIRTVKRAMPADCHIYVWDDGSTDGTSEAVELAGGERSTVFSSTSSVGSGAARRELMRRTDSEFIACMDADDVCLPWRFSLQSRAAPAADFVFSTMIEFRSGDPRLHVNRPIRLTPSETRIALLVMNPLPHSTMLARRASIDAVGGYSAERLGQDYELWLRAAAAGARIARVATPTVGYRRSATQVSSLPGYERALIGSAAIRSSYERLYASLGGEAGSPGGVAAFVRERLPQFSSPARRYFQKKLDANEVFGRLIET